LNIHDIRQVQNKLRMGYIEEALLYLEEDLFIVEQELEAMLIQRSVLRRELSQVGQMEMNFMENVVEIRDEA